MTDHSPNATRLTGGCQCGAVRYAVSSQPTSPGICHCRMCQKASGGPYMAFAGVPEADVTWTRGTLATYASSNTATRGFCAACGTPLTFKWQPTTISFTICSFDTPEVIIPTEVLGIESLLRWSEHIGKLPRQATPDMPPTFVNHQQPDHDT